MAAKIPEPPKVTKRIEEVVHKIEMPTGLMGITDAWKNLQEAMLKSDSPDERMAGSLEHGEELWEKQVDAQLETNTKLDKLITAGGAVA
jgi:hypothetical protein